MLVSGGQILAIDKIYTDGTTLVGDGVQQPAAVNTEVIATTNLVSGTSAELQSEIYNINDKFGDYYKKTETSSKDEIQTALCQKQNVSDMSVYAQTAWVNNNYQRKGDYVASASDKLAGKTLVLKDNQWIELTAHDWTDEIAEASAAAVNSAVDTVRNKFDLTEDNKISGYDNTPFYHQSLEGYATEEYVNTKIDETSSWANDTFQEKGNYTSADDFNNYKTEVEQEFENTSAWANEKFQEKGYYLSANALDDISGKWESVNDTVTTASGYWNEVSAYSATSGKFVTSAGVEFNPALAYFLKKDENAEAVSWTGVNLALKEDVSNKAQTLIVTSTTDYPSSKTVADFVNSSIATNTANFLGTIAESSLGLDYTATNSQIALALDAHSWISSPTNNDYCFVSVNDPQTTDVDEYRRFKFNGNVWDYEYTLNNSSFTQAQWNAINSGIDSSDKSDWDNHLLNTNNPHNVTKSQIGLGNVDNTSDLDKPVSTAMQTALNAKADDSAVVHKAGTETINGIKTFNNAVSPRWTSNNFIKQSKVFIGSIIKPYSEWTSTQKDGNHFRMWTLDITSSMSVVNTHCNIVVKLMGSYYNTPGIGTLQKEITFQVYEGNLIISKDDYTVAQPPCADEFAISGVIKSGNSYLVQVTNRNPTANNYPLYIEIDVVNRDTNVVLDNVTLTESITEGLPSWAVNVAQVTAGGSPVLTEATAATVAKTGSYNDIIDKPNKYPADITVGDSMTLTGINLESGKRWTAVTHGQTWSRILQGLSAELACTAILSLAATRASVVYNATFLICSTHSGAAEPFIAELGSGKYTQVQLRLVYSSDSGSFFIEIYDTANNIAVGTAQSWKCTLYPLIGTAFNAYTTFVDGTTIPSGYTARQELITAGGHSSVAIRNISFSGTTLTVTRQDGSTFTVSGLASDSSVVHRTGTETITGQKIFSGNYGPALANSVSMWQTVLLPCTAIQWYNDWSTQQKDGNHYRQWEIDITSIVSASSTHACVQVTLKSDWRTLTGYGILRKSISFQLWQSSLVSNIGDYIEANGNAAQYFRISNVLHDNNKYVIRIINSQPESNNYPILLKTDFLKTTGETQPILTESIVEGWPEWAGDKNTPVRVTASGSPVLTEATAAAVARTGNYNDLINKPSMIGKIHFLKAVGDSLADISAPYGYWIVDLEKPNAESPYGYDYAMASEIMAKLSAGEIFVLSTYSTAPSTEEDLFIMSHARDQTVEGHVAIRIWFTCMFASAHPEYMHYTTIYTPAMYNTNNALTYPEERMAILNFQGEQSPLNQIRFMQYTNLANVATTGSYNDLINKPTTVNVKQIDSNTDTSSFTFVNGHIYHLTVYIQGSPLSIDTHNSGTGHIIAYIGNLFAYSCEQTVNIQNGVLTTNDIRLPIDWKAENIIDTIDNQLHVVIWFNSIKYTFNSSSDYKLTLMGTESS